MGASHQRVGHQTRLALHDPRYSLMVDMRTLMVAFVPQAGLGPSIRSKSSPAPENFFCKNAFHRKATPFLGQKPFLDRFLGEGA